jgi:hypothetical protein
VFAIPIKYEQGLPFFWTTLFGISTTIIVFLLDILGPIAFLYWVWNKKTWGAKVAYIYIWVFILNSMFAAFTHGDQYWVVPLLIPAVAYAIFWVVIYRNRKYFS